MRRLALHLWARVLEVRASRAFLRDDIASFWRLQSRAEEVFHRLDRGRP